MATKRGAWQNRIVGEDIVDADQLLVNPRNWRIHPKTQQDVLAGSLDELGWIQRVIVNKRTGHVVDGHARIEQAITRNERVPVLYVDLSEDEEKLALSIIDPISAMAVTDAEKLAELLAGVTSGDEAVMGMLAELAANNPVPHEVGTDLGAQMDRAEELQAKWQVKRGDLWAIGKHRLLCGDSTNVEDVAKIAFPADYILFCDPFFQDHLIDDLVRLYDFSNGVFITGGKQLKEILNRLDNFLEGTFIGGATSPQMGQTATLMFEHKIILWSYIKPLKFKLGQSSIIESSEGATRLYGDVYRHTSKPVDVCETLLYPFRQTEVIDCFAGSGSSLVASERLRKRWWGIEIEPKYCAVILERASQMGLECNRA